MTDLGQKTEHGHSHLCFSYVIIYGELSAILLLEPKAIDGVNKGEVLLFFLYDILVLKGLLVLDNRVRVAQVIDLLHGLRREMLLTMGYRLEHLYLCGAQRLRIILKHRGIDVQHLLQTQREYLFSHL